MNDRYFRKEIKTLNIISEFKEWLTTDKPMDRYVGDNFIKFVAWISLLIGYTIFISISFILLLVTAPVWLIPYLIYNTLKEKRKRAFARITRSLMKGD